MKTLLWKTEKLEIVSSFDNFVFISFIFSFFYFHFFYILRFNKQFFFLATVRRVSKYVFQNIPKTVKEEKAKRFKQTYRLVF